MNILLVSQCSKNALTETRRILDQFAERRGDRTWQTAITQNGLDTLYRLLRKTARKNTAVACHWIRGKDHSELLWIVGDARQFNGRGAAPTNTTRRDVIRSGDENDWHAAEDIRLLARIAALFHDLGKASDTFQAKLQSIQALADPFRHEWVSLRLFEAFVGKDCPSDQDWLTRLEALENGVAPSLLATLLKDGQTPAPFSGPFSTLTLPLARAVGWLIVSHHRLPAPVSDRDKERLLRPEQLAKLPGGIVHAWCGSRLEAATVDDDTTPLAEARVQAKDRAKASAGCWRFSRGLPLDSRHWRQHAARVAGALLKRPGLSSSETGQGVASPLASPYVLHLARMALMLADHDYSSQPSHARYGDPIKRGGKGLYANTRKAEGDAEKTLNQRLDEHLIGVEVSADRLMKSLPRLERSLPRIARHKGFRERTKGAFRWQNEAFDLAESLRDRATRQGFFGVNLASTGCGKTFANARILYGLADPQQGARFTAALGLRTLTLQTGDAYRERLRLDAVDLAVLAGGTATASLHAYHQAQERARMAEGSESAASLLPDYNHVRYEGCLEEGPLKRWLGANARGRNSRVGSLLDAPVLVCTVDHLMPAVEGTRGGRQILPMLRLMTSDLVLDEPDDFDLADLPALTRLVHWAGLLGSRVLLSSATLPPVLVQGLFIAYCAGREVFQRHRGQPGAALEVCCAWFDEFGAQAGQHGANEGGAAFLADHERFIDRRIARLTANARVRRRAEILPVDLPSLDGAFANTPAAKLAHAGKYLAELFLANALRLHARHHTVDPVSGKRVSFGLIRMANINPLFEVALNLFHQGAPEGSRVNLCVYHSRHPLLVRAEMEKTLDGALKRHQPDAAFAQPAVREALDGNPEPDQLFIVLATAVAEIGRDLDHDWAIVEPSSMRSIIQLAGRVKRHRDEVCPDDQPNILLLDANFKGLEDRGERPVFLKPGFESDAPAFRLKTHRLSELLTLEQYRTIDARPRIRPRSRLDPNGNLADLEHARLADLMLGAGEGGTQVAVPVKWWWQTQAHLSGALQAHDPFRADPEGHRTCYFKPDEDGETVEFRLFNDEGQETGAENLLQRLSAQDLAIGPRILPWAMPDYLTALQALAEAEGMGLQEAARKFGTVDLPGRDMDQRWRYHPALGFGRV